MEAARPTCLVCTLPRAAGKGGALSLPPAVGVVLPHEPGHRAWRSWGADTMNQLVLSTLLLLLLLPGQLARACPTGCQCQDPTTILCAARRGHTVPRGLPPSTLSLYVFENGITMLSEDSFAGLPALQLLDLSQNKITSIQKNIFQPLTELVNLDLSSNQLQEITNETFHGLRLLERLYLQKNRIQHIHATAFDTLENLLELKLQNNQLRAVPPLDLPNLLLLDISWNKIPTITPGALHAINIESLKIAGLGLTSLDEELFQPQNNLHELDVSDNLLERVPVVLRRLGSLTKLSLAGNAHISQLPPEDFRGLHNLQELDISNLNINTIPRDFSRFFPRLRAMTAAGNPFNCICQMSWLVQWVNASGVLLRRPEETRCHFPPKNSGKLLHHLQYADFGCPTTTTTTAATTSPPRTTALRPPVPIPTGSRPPPEPSSTTATLQPRAVPFSSTPVPFSLTPAASSPQPQLCPPRTCLNGGTCQLGARGHLRCLCPPGFAGAFCEEEEEEEEEEEAAARGTTLSPATPAAPPSRKISITQVSSTSLRVDLQNYMQSKAQLRGIRLSYRNLSGPEKRPVMLRLPATLSEYTVRALKPNCTYRVCVGPLGEKGSKEEFCVEAHTLPASHQQHSPVTQSKDNNLALMIVPALAAVLLLVVVVTAVTYYRRHRRAKEHAGGGVEAGPLELEGVKACLENGERGGHGCRGTENAVLAGGPECEVPLMQAHYPSNNNSATLKPSYF
ncbi:vasorin isoform X1 [Gallus gallus]|uniref:vasorin isoform X1 n=2 Tax=Gallus gallus TaxID=9031 RepID=UPI001AE2E121|nr:vasorin isoform X1 [Gallus gallus]